MMNWGIIGGGKVVETKSGPAFNVAGKSRVYAVTRRDQDQARKTANTLGAARAYTAIDDMLADTNVNAIYVATPPGLHYPHLQQILPARKPVYIEKPFVVTGAQARDITAAFAQASVPLMVAHPLRAWPRFHMIKEKLAEMGPIDEFHLTCDRRLEDDIHHPWLYNVALSGGGKFFDIASHYIDIIYYLLGPVQVLDRRVTFGQSPNGLEDTVHAKLQLQHGGMGTIDYNLVSTRKDDQVVVRAGVKTLTFPVLARGPVIYNDGRQDSQLDYPIPALEQADMIRQVVAYLNGEPNATPCFAHDALRVVETIETIYKGP